MSTIKRFLIEKYLSSSIALISKTYYHYINDVLKIKPKDKIVLLDGKGNIFEGILQKLDKNQIVAEIVCKIDKKESVTQICCAYSIPKGKRHEILIEKLTEIGIAEFFPVKFHYSVKYEFNVNSNKYKRLKKIIASAMTQSTNINEPILHEETTFEEFIELTKSFTFKIFGKSKSHIALNKLLETKQNQLQILYVIGPEGGFTSYEEGIMEKNDFIPVKISSNTLRIETASILTGGILKLLQTSS